MLAVRQADQASKQASGGGSLLRPRVCASQSPCHSTRRVRCSRWRNTGAAFSPRHAAAGAHPAALALATAATAAHPQLRAAQVRAAARRRRLRKLHPVGCPLVGHRPVLLQAQGDGCRRRQRALTQRGQRARRRRAAGVELLRSCLTCCTSSCSWAANACREGCSSWVPSPASPPGVPLLPLWPLPPAAASLAAALSRCASSSCLAASCKPMKTSIEALEQSTACTSQIYAVRQVWNRGVLQRACGPHGAAGSCLSSRL